MYLLSLSLVSCVIHINYVFSAEEWVRAINNPTLKIEEAHTYSFSKYVCHRHFATDQFTTPKRLRLNRGAIPTLFLTSSDNSEICPSELEMHKVVSSVRLVIVKWFVWLCGVMSHTYGICKLLNLLSSATSYKPFKACFVLMGSNLSSFTLVDLCFFCHWEGAYTLAWECV